MVNYSFIIVSVAIFLTALSSYSQLELPTCPHCPEPTEYTGFWLSYSEEHEQAWYVAYELTKDEVRGQFPRKNNFREDKRIATRSASLEDYRNSGYDRGHLAPAKDMAWSKESMNASFLLSNVSPKEPGFNRGIWKSLESKVRRWASNFDTVYVVTGPVLDDNLKTIGENSVSVPDYFFKVLLVRKKQAIGFIMPNAKCDNKFPAYAVSVDSVENVTGIDFFPMLDDSIENEIENGFRLRDWR